MKTNSKVLAHFRKRSERYERSSGWVGDQGLLDRLFELSGARKTDVVLDVATGTGLVAARFKGRVKEVVGLDVSRDMAGRSAGRLDRLVIAPVEEVPLADASVDVCVCRQGLQFVDLPRALAELARLLRPGGRAVLCHLTAYGEEDAPEAFRIQALRNPARANFFKPGDMEAALERAGLKVVAARRHLSPESVDRWTNHGAISAARRSEIKRAYRDASAAFRRLHRLEPEGDDVIDVMPFSLIRAERRP